VDQSANADPVSNFHLRHGSLSRKLSERHRKLSSEERPGAKNFLS
jgi:hypothetical protein